MEVAADEGLEALTVGEFDVEHPAVTLNQAEGIELPLITLIIQGAEVAPVDLEALAGVKAPCARKRGADAEGAGVG